jgi:hypothetical protein
MTRSRPAESAAERLLLLLWMHCAAISSQSRAGRNRNRKSPIRNPSIVIGISSTAHNSKAGRY